MEITTRQHSQWSAPAGGGRPAADAAAPAEQRVGAERIVAERIVEGEVLGRARPGAAPFSASAGGLPAGHGLAAYIANAAFAAGQSERARISLDCYA